MSISSLLGSDSERTTRDNIGNNYREGPSQTQKNTISSPGSQSMPARSPTGSISGGHQQYLPHSPNPGRHYSASAAALRFRAYSGGAQTRPYTTPKGNSRLDVGGVTSGLPHGDVIVRSAPLESQSSDLQRFLSDTKKERNDTKRAVDRPNSQPNGVRTPPRNRTKTSMTQLALHEEHNRPPREAERAYEHSLEASREGDAMNVKQNLRTPTEHGIGEIRPPMERTNESISFQCAAQQQQLNGTGSLETMVAAGKTLSRKAYNIAAMTSQSLDGRIAQGQNSSSQSPFSPDPLRPPHVERLLVTSSAQETSRLSPVHLHSRLSSLIDEQSVTPIPPSANTSGAAGGDDLSVEQVPHHTKTREDNQHPPLRSSLALFVENSKRGGRVSPLPQAVQGAQRQSMTPASDPGIKSEFARMFSGIGSGVGSGMPRPALADSGPSSPFTHRSPTRVWEAERPLPLAGRSSLVELNKPRVASRGGRRSRKTRYEEVKTDDNNVDSLGIPSTRGMKRGRHTHHHHQKLPNHQ